MQPVARASLTNATSPDPSRRTNCCYNINNSLVQARDNLVRFSPSCDNIYNSLIQARDNLVFFSPLATGYGLYQGLHYYYGEGAPFLAACSGIGITSYILGENINWNLQSTYQTNPKEAALEYFRISFLLSFIPIYLNC